MSAGDKYGDLIRRLRGLAGQIDGEEFVPDAVDAARVNAAANAIEELTARPSQVTPSIKTALGYIALFKDDQKSSRTLDWGLILLAEQALKNAAPQSSPDNGHCSKGTENKAAESAPTAEGPSMSASQERLLRVKLKAAGLSDEDFMAKYPHYSLTPKEGRVVVPKGVVNEILSWIETAGAV